jgi:hypothetical protein
MQKWKKIGIAILGIAILLIVFWKKDRIRRGLLRIISK